jgi:hypothetical protein
MSRGGRRPRRIGPGDAASPSKIRANATRAIPSASSSRNASAGASRHRFAFTGTSKRRSALSGSGPTAKTSRAALTKATDPSAGGHAIALDPRRALTDHQRAAT